eukprot:CAMPEP_0168380272 /NCGR_PEP_ID=MMETSP0228-20121227/12272_1 /TAXON_ID=133427 /ORGANISM="Protoceratium reticulatum, Strain CCCM 535 (=CCMP 1889)" /LENGTH=76 /DNA_ID=CAMNT_0008393327 /DNA_START=165 /DNA_END=395 /DNA_ORIENTATION=+
MMLPRAVLGILLQLSKLVMAVLGDADLLVLTGVVGVGVVRAGLGHRAELAALLALVHDVLVHVLALILRLTALVRA